MHRFGPLALLSVQLLALAACPNEQVNPGISVGLSGGGVVTTAQPITGSSTSESSTGSDAVPTEASSTGTSGGASTDAASSSGTSSSSSTGDSGLAGTSEASTGEPPKLTDCFDCLCDINISFCRKVFYAVQGAAFQGGSDEQCLIVDAETDQSGCVLYPPECGETPDCECLPKMDGGCFCFEVSPGSFQVTCPLP